MPFDFPNTPTVGQIITGPNGVPYQWDGAKWVVAVAIYAPLASPVFTGDPRVPTPAAADNDTSIPNTQWVKSTISASGGIPPTGGTMTGPLNYTATGGTTSRSAQDRAAEWTNVKDFGAKMDGTTDDLAAITAAIATLVAGDVLYFPPSPTACMLSQRLLIPFNVTLWALPGSVTLKPTAGNTSNPLLLVPNNNVAGTQSNILIYGLTFDGGGQDFGSANPVVTLFQQTGITFDHCAFQNTRGIAVNGSRINDLAVRACTFTNIGNHWKTTTVASDRQQALSNINDLAGTWGQRMTVSGCYFSNVGLDCVNLNTISDVNITGNTFNLALQHATLTASAYPAAIFPPFCANLSVVGNTVISAPGNALDLPGVSHAAISGNTFRGCGSCGIGVFDQATGPTADTNIVIIGNVIENCGLWSGAQVRAGIGFYTPNVAASNIRIANNILSDTQGTPTQQYGVQLAATGFAPTNVWIDASNSMVGNVIAAISANMPATTYSAIAVTGGTINGAVIGGVTPAAGTFSGVTVAGGALQVGTGTTGQPVNVVGPANISRAVNCYTGTTASSGLRWVVGADGSGEGGSNAGSNLVFQGFSDSGTLVAQSYIVRQTGAWNMPANLTVGGNTTFSNSFSVNTSNSSTFGTGAGGATITFNGGGGSGARGINISGSGTQVWYVGAANTQDYVVTRYVSGTATDNPITIRNASGQVEFGISNADTIVGKQSAKTLTDTAGFLAIPFCAGAPTGVPANAAKGMCMVYDTTNHKLWAYDGGWKGVVLS